MTIIRKKRKKLRWWQKIKRWLSKIVTHSTENKVPSTKSKIRKKRRRRHKTTSGKQGWQNLINLFQPTPPKRRRRNKKPLIKRIYLRWLNFTKNLLQNTKTPQKRRRKRKRKQYAVYEMSHLKQK